MIEKIIPVLEIVESNGDVNAVGDNGKALGILQIHKEAVMDVNRRFGTSYDHEDCRDREKSRQICRYYLQIAHDYIKSKEDREVTEEDLVRSWNGGAYSGWENKKTRLYWKNYQHVRSRHYGVCIFDCGNTSGEDICKNCGSYILD